MTPKELLYVEDCLGMEQQAQTKCADYSSKVQNPTIKASLVNLSAKHQARFDGLMAQL